MKVHMLNHSRGVGLIEVLITMLLLSTALLTLASLQARSLEYNQSSYFRSQANILAYDILDRIRINKKVITDYNFTLAAVPTSATGSSKGALDLYEWRKDVNTRLPSSKAGIDCNASTRVCTVTISWSELNTSEHTHNFGARNTDDTATFSYMTRIPEAAQ